MKGNQFKQENQYKYGFLPSKTSKKSLRAFYRSQLSEMPFSHRKQKTEKINNLLLKLPFWRQPRFISIYKAFEQEPCLSAFYSVWKNKICFPVIKGEQLAFYTNKKDLWRKNKFDIREPFPKEKDKVTVKDISVFLIPGLAFDRKGGRLGRGQAYYDKTLFSIQRNQALDMSLKWNKQALFIGVAFVEQINKTALPLSHYDVLMDCVVTDQFVLWPLNSQKGGK